MPQERLAYPGTALQNQAPVRKKQELFGGGQNSDDPASSIGESELAEILNLIPFAKHSIARSGSTLMNSLRVPYINVYETSPTLFTFTCTKVAKRVTINTGGRGYADLVEGNYLQWADGDQDQIGEITVPETGDPYFDAVVSGGKAQDSECYQQARIWGIGWNQNVKKIVIQAGTKLYFTTSAFAVYTEIKPIETDDESVIDESRTRFEEDEEQIIGFNAHGQFKIYFDENSAYYFKMNSGQPTVRIYEDPLLPLQEYFRNRIYTVSRIIGVGSLLGSRNTAEVVFQHESAPVLPDSDHKDTSIGYTKRPIGRGNIVYQEIVAGATVDLDVTHYNIYDDAAFGIGISYDTEIDADDLVIDIINDLDECDNMGDVCAEIQRNLRDFFPDARCFLRVNDGGGTELVIDTGEIDGATISYVSAPSSGTDISSLLDMSGGGTPLGSINNVKANEPQLVMDLNTPGQKGTHFSIYESKNGGKAGIKLGNIFDELTWAKDIPIIKVFMGSIDASKNISVQDDEKILGKEDEGSFVICGDDRSIYRIDSLLSPTGDESTNALEAEASSVYASATGSAEVKADVPMAIGAKKISQAYQEGATVFLDPTMTEEWNQLSDDDVGKILFCQDGTPRHIIAVADEYTATVHEEIEFGTSGATPVYEAIAWDPIMRSATGSNNTKLVKFDKSATPFREGWLYRTGGDEFADADIGKYVMLFKAGSLKPLNEILVTIQSDEANTADKVKVTLSGKPWVDAAMVGMWGIVTDYAPARFFNDYVTDDELDANADDPAYLLQTRFFRPLPSSPIGALGGAFMFVAETDTNKISYSEIPSTRKYIAGFHHPSWQADTNIKDTITLLKYYQDRMVAFGKTSTWASNISAMSSIKTPDIGEEIFAIPAFGIVDQIGLIHVDSIQDIGIGQSILMVSDFGFASFDGRQFQRNAAFENKIRKILSLWHTTVMSSYDPVGGYMIFGSPNVSPDTRNYVNMTEGECFRLAILATQGSGWCRFGGAAMVSPFPNTGGLKIENGYGMPIQIILDELTGKWNQISTFDGPEGSDLEKSYTDKGSTEIVSSVKARIHQGNKPSIMLEHLLSKVGIRPEEQGGGYRNGFGVTAKIYENQETTYTAQQTVISAGDDVSFNKRIEATDLQAEFEFSTSGFILENFETDYNTRDTAGATEMSGRATAEDGYQKEYSE